MCLRCEEPSRRPVVGGCLRERIRGWPRRRPRLSRRSPTVIGCQGSRPVGRWPVAGRRAWVRLFWSSGRRRSGTTTPHRRPSRWPVTGRRDRQVRMVPRSRGRKPHARPGFAVPVQQVAGQGPIALGGDLRPSIAECYGDDADPGPRVRREAQAVGGSALADWTAPYQEGAAPSAPVIHETAGHIHEKNH
jgi:hypothetical protein